MVASGGEGGGGEMSLLSTTGRALFYFFFKHAGGGRSLRRFVAKGQGWPRGSGFELRVTTARRRSIVDGERGFERAPDTAVQRAARRKVRAMNIAFTVNAKCKARIVAHGAFGADRAHSRGHALALVKRRTQCVGAVAATDWPNVQ